MNQIQSTLFALKLRWCDANEVICTQCSGENELVDRYHNLIEFSCTKNTITSISMRKKISGKWWIVVSHNNLTRRMSHQPPASGRSVFIDSSADCSAFRCDAVVVVCVLFFLIGNLELEIEWNWHRRGFITAQHGRHCRQTRINSIFAWQKCVLFMNPVERLLYHY